jgi:capsular polysaccharide biosynthesis protein
MKRLPSELRHRARRANELRRRVFGVTPGRSAAVRGTFYTDLLSLLPTVVRGGPTGADEPSRTPNVAVLAGPGQTELGVVLDALGSARIRVFGPRALPEWRLVRRGITHVKSSHIGTTAWNFKRYGPFDVVVNCSPAGKDGQLYALRRLFLHLRADGSYLLDRSVVTEQEWAEIVAELATVAPLATGADDIEEDAGAPTPEDEFSAAVRGVMIDRFALAVTKRNDHWVKLRNEQADRFLATRAVPATSRMITTVPAGRFDSRAELTLHESTTQPVDFPRSFEYPQLYLHEYTGEITLASHSLLYCENTVLPESFRYQQTSVLTNTKLIDPALARTPGSAPKWSAGFARVPDDLQADTELDGRYYHLDCPYPGHFGHLMTEVVSRLWGWRQAKLEDPELKAILRVYRGDRTPRLERTIFNAYGIDPDDVVWTGEPVRVNSIVGATPMFQNAAPYYIHPDIADTYHRLQQGLIIPGAPSQEKIFVSRQDTMRRACRNARDVEQYFVDRGFTVIYPETMDLAHQATVFAGARVVAGFGGSAMFNILFARQLEHLIVLTHDSYVTLNEYLYASVLGCRTDYLWSDPDIWHPDGGWSNDAFQSPWTFDFARNRPILDKII